jgi:hypothetical protein
MVVPDFPAGDVSVSQTLGLLDGPFEGLATGVADGTYALWLGSGISLARVDGLRGVIRRVLHFVQAQMSDAEDCPFRQALKDIIALGAAAGVESTDLDLNAEIDAWPRIDRLVEALLSQYSTMLDVRIEGQRRDYLLWEGVDVVTTYGTSAGTPDAEHLCLAILIAEGVAPQIASANWDGLIETAIEQLGYQLEDLLRVCVVGDDFQLPDLRSRLTKFHGCARRAASDPDRYRDLLIARKSQISRWKTMPDYANTAAELTSLAANRRTLMIGLSAQDEDIQQLFVDADQLTTWSWRDHQPPHAFAEEELGPLQMNILKVLYDADFDDHGSDILRSAKVRAYAKSLLVALVLDVLTRKLKKHLLLVSSTLDDSEIESLSIGLNVLRDLAAEACLKDGELAFVERVVATSKALGATFDTGNPNQASARYRPLGPFPVHQIPSDPGLESGGIRELAAALALVGRGHAVGSWTVRPLGGAGASGAVVLTSDTFGETRVFLCADLESGEMLFESGVLVEGSGDAVVLYSRGRMERRRRHPSSRRGRTGHLGIREVAIADLLATTASAGELDSVFAQAVVA